MNLFEPGAFFYDGRWAAPSSAETIDVIDPASEEVAGRVPAATPADVDAAVASARRAFDDGPWPRMSAGERADALDAWAKALRARAGDVTALVRAELGTPVAFAARMEDPPPAALEFFANVARSRTPFESRTRLDGGRSIVVEEPGGVVGAIMPWNGPPYSAAKKAGAALAAGCTVVLKPPPEAPLSLYPMAQAAAEAGLPPGVLNLVPGDAAIGQRLVADDRVDHVTFTGSLEAGRRIAAVCGPAMRRTTLELGGKSAGIILDDVDLAEIGPLLAAISTTNAGQACLLFSRLLVSERRHDEFVDVLVANIEKIRVGHPDDPATRMGPVANRAHRDRVERFIGIAQEDGARIVSGGGRTAGMERGFYLDPTVVDGVTNRMRIAREEVYGPVVSVLTYSDLDEAVAIANDSQYGLSGGVFTRDDALGFDVARRVRAGTFNVNSFAFDIGVPFGGVKASGVGREGGVEGYEQFIEYKTVNLAVGSRFVPAAGQE